jgi:capsid protein
MKRTKRTPQEIRDDAKARYETLVYKRRTKKMRDVKNKYDAVDGNTEKRRAPKIERYEEEKLLKPYDRLKMINLCRDLERNSTSAKSILRQFKVNVVGTLGKMKLNTKDEETNRTVNEWFNQEWAPKSDSRGDLTFNEQLKLVMTSTIREGDILAVFDDFDRDDGKMLYWEADQLVEINATDWENQKKYLDTDGKPLQQSSGVIYDKKGRVMYYAVTSDRGKTVCDLEDATIFPVGVARLIKNNFRPNQLRGTGDFFAALADMEDNYEMRAKELQSAKRAATTAAVVTKQDATEEAMFRGGTAPEGLLDAGDDTEESTTETINYENLETLTGGMTEYLLPDEDVKILDTANRPNIHMKEFFDFVLQSAGSGMGLAKAYTFLEAHSSYTAFRGEMVMTWATFYDWQKFLENHIADWVAVKAIKWAIEKGKLKVNLPDGWEKMISWIFPQMPQVDPVKDNTARREAMKDGFLSFADVLGADWKKKLESVADGLKVAQELGIPLTAFETKSGGLTQENNNAED